MHQTTEPQNTWSKIWELRGEIDKSTITAVDLNNPISAIDGTTRQGMSNDTEQLNNKSTKWTSVTGIEHFTLKKRVNVLFKHTWNIYKDRRYPGPQNKPQQIKRIEIIQKSSLTITESN